MINSTIKRLRSDDEGYDLIQLLIVVVILGALATIATILLLNQAGKGETAAIKADIQNAVGVASRIQSEDGSTTAWVSGIDGDIEAAVPDSVASVNNTTDVLTIVVSKDGTPADTDDPHAKAVIALDPPSVAYSGQAAP